MIMLNELSFNQLSFQAMLYFIQNHRCGPYSLRRNLRPDQVIADLEIMVECFYKLLMVSVSYSNASVIDNICILFGIFVTFPPFISQDKVRIIFPFSLRTDQMKGVFHLNRWHKQLSRMSPARHLYLDFMLGSIAKFSLNLDERK